MRSFPALFTVASLCCITGCNIEGSVSGLADSLLDPEPSTVEGPGRRIAKGSYSDLELDASLSVGARLLALRHDREDSELAIIPFEGGEACHVGPATRFMRLASQVDVNLTPIVGYLGERENGQGTLHFVDFSCDEVMAPIEQVGLPQVLYPRGKATGLLTLSGAGFVYFIDVTKPEVRVVAENVRSGRVGSTHLWLIEEGRLLARNDAFEVEASYGSEVLEFALFSGLEAPGVTDAAYIEGGALFLVSGTNGEPQKLAEDACAITDIGHAGAFAFYSPCSTRQLAIAYRGDLAGLDADVVVAHLSDQTLDPRQLDLYWGEGHGAALFLVGENADADSGELVFQGFDAESGVAGEPTSLAEQAHIDGSGVVFLDYEAGVGELTQVVVENDDDGRPEFRTLEKLADHVAQLPGVTVSSSVGVLGNFEATDETGDLLLFSDELSAAPKTLARGVPVQRHSRDSTHERSAFVADFDGETGTAYVLDQAKAIALGRNVLPNSLQFVALPDSIAYLATSTSTERALTLFLMDPQLEVTLNERVNEFHSLPWPSPGMLYSVDQGDSAGIWFARAK